ncbi:MAG: hypothetical protein ABIT38_03145, partial [Gemmatimonadaceae bacterium]
MIETRLRNRHHLLIDAFLLCVACVLAYSLRFEGTGWIATYGRDAATYLAISLPLRIAIFYALGMYAQLWYMASVAEMERVLAAGLLGATASSALALFILPAFGLLGSRIPLGVVGLDVLLGTGAIAISRFLPRVAWWRAHRRAIAGGERALIVGAGQAGQMTVRELHANPQLGLTPVGFVDDDRNKIGHRLMDLPVLGAIADLPGI